LQEEWNISDKQGKQTHF